MSSADTYFSRQRAVDAQIFEMMRAASAVGFGLGNIGGPAVVELGRAGIGRLLLVDYGTVEEPNLSRGIFTARDLGMPKVDAAARTLAERAPYTEVETLFGDVRVDIPESLITQYDIVVVATDSWSSRMFINAWAHRLPGRTQCVVSGGLSGLCWDVIVAVPGGNGGCMQCPYDASIALADEEGGCSPTAGAGNVVGFDPSVSFAGLAAAAEMVTAAVDVVGRRDRRLAGSMISFDHYRYRRDLLRIAANPGCGGHFRLRPDEYVVVPVADYVVGNLAQMIAAKTGATMPVPLAVERELVAEVICGGCGRRQAVWRPLVAWKHAVRACLACGSTDATAVTETVLRPNRRLSDHGVVTGKALRALVDGRWTYVIPKE